MRLHRATLVVISTLFTVGMTSIASAGCCDWGVAAPVAYGSTGCGGCGASVAYAEPIAPAPITVSGCGGCGVSSAAAVFAQPVAPTLAPLSVGAWGTGCSCGRSVVYVAAPAAPVAPGPLYVVNQGPEYSGPGIMNPYRTYSPAAGYAPAANYPYVPGYGYGPRLGYGYGAPVYRPRPIYRPRVAVYGGPAYARPHYYAPMPRMRPYWHRPLGVRG